MDNIQLDFEAAKLLGLKNPRVISGQVFVDASDRASYAFSPTSNFNHAAKIILKGLWLKSNDSATEWACGMLSKNRADGKPGPLTYDKDPLVAITRSFVTSNQ